MEYRVRELLEKFLKAYMSERDLEKTLEFVSDEIISIGTGVQETAGNKRLQEQDRLCPGCRRTVRHADIGRTGISEYGINVPVPGNAGTASRIQES